MVGAAGGFVVGSVIGSRRSQQMISAQMVRWMAVLCPLLLVPAFHRYGGVWGAAALSGASSLALATIMPGLNGLFVRALLPSLRARAFSVIQSGLNLIQGGAVAAAGALGQSFGSIAGVISAWGAAGVLVMIVVVAFWPNPAVVAKTIATVRSLSEPHRPRHAAVDLEEDTTLDLGKPVVPQRRPTTRRSAPAPRREANPGDRTPASG